MLHLDRLELALPLVALCHFPAQALVQVLVAAHLQALALSLVALAMVAGLVPIALAMALATTLAALVVLAKEGQDLVHKDQQEE